MSDATTAAADVTAAYEMVVGLEVHVQLKTRTKAFCGCSSEFGAAPNTNTCPVCLGLPGTLPALNGHAVELATRAALALGCHVNERSVFARKNYFYPDLPKGYQISQFDVPLAECGALRIGTLADGTPITVRITRVHMEEDAGKSIHDRYVGATAVDLNRAGVPLVEIVSEPDMRSSAEAGAYLRAMRQLLEYAGVSDVSMEEGSMRVDANVSARLKGATRLGTKSEVKNMNSISGVERALEAEFARQCGVLAAGGTVQQQTMLWDGARGEVRPSRTKEGSHDYRYFPEPDLPPLVLDRDWIAAQKASLPELPDAKRERFAKEYELGEYDRRVLTDDPRLTDYFETVARTHGNPKTAANWVLNDVLSALNVSGRELTGFTVRPRDLAQLLDMVRDARISNHAAKQVFAEMVRTGDRAEQVAERMKLLQVGDDDAIERWIDEALAERPAEAERFQAGERKLQGVFVGAVMKKSGGTADPKKLNQLLGKRAGGA